MRIACVAPSAVPSTTANSIQAMKACHALAQVDGPVRLWVPGELPTAWTDLAKRYGLKTPFEVSWLRSPRFLRRYDFAWRSVQQAKAWKADLIYTWLPQAAVLTLWSGLPAILEVHDLPSGLLGPRFFRRFLRQSGKKRLLVITEALRSKLDKAYRLTLGPDQVLIAPNGSEPERYTELPEPAEARRQLGLPEGFTAVYTGHFYHGRGMDILFGLAEFFPQVNFLWAGGRDKDVASWKKYLEQAGIRNVALTGFIENQDLPLYQAAGEVLLMPYEREISGSSGGNSVDICSPMKMFDYLAVGRVILASDLPVLHEVLNVGNAILCPPEALSGWQQALANVLADPIHCQQLAGQARSDSVRYSWQERARRALSGFCQPA